MRKIIKNKKYDTDTARKVATRTEYMGYVDKYIRETLYQKKTGEYFLHGQGGADTKYGKYKGDTLWEAGQKITPFTPDQARDWADFHLNAEEYNKIFVNAPKMPGKGYVTYYLDNELIERIKFSAQRNGMTASEWLATKL